MQKAELIEVIAKKTSLSKKIVTKVLTTMVGVITDELKAGNKVNITSFGTFSSMVRHARGGVDPRDPKKRITIPAVRVAKFQTGKKLRDTLKEIADSSVNNGEQNSSSNSDAFSSFGELINGESTSSESRDDNSSSEENR